MASPDLVPADRTGYRGMRNRNWVKRGSVTYLAFLLRPATDVFPAETEISLGLTPESAVDELKENFGIGFLAVANVHELPHNLSVRFNPENPFKADILGLPTHSQDEVQRGLAVTIATDLAALTKLL